MSARRVLLVAYQCGPGMGSVSQIGWEWFARLRQTHAVTLVTQVRNRAALTAAGVDTGGDAVLWIDSEWFAGPLYRLAKKMFPKSEHSVFLLSSLDYFVFDFLAWCRLRRAIAQGQRWDLLHRVTPVTLAAPTWLVRLPMPSVIGPLNSGLSDPPGFGQVMRQESTWLVQLRRLGRAWDELTGCLRRASRILVATRSTQQQVPAAHQDRCRPMLENGVDLQRFPAHPWPQPPASGQPLQLLFVGRLIPVKALHLLLQAVAQLCQVGADLRLTVVGDGPLRTDWQALCIQLGLEDVVSFTGAQPLDAVARHMAACHLLCLPSLRESGGAVVLEAMASARPVVAMNFGGPAELVDDSVGRLLALQSPEQVVRDLAAALADVVLHPEAWRERGQEGRRRVEARYGWDAKVRAIDALYDDILLEGQPS